MFCTISCYCIGVKESNIQAGTYKQLIQLYIVTMHVPQDKNRHFECGKYCTVQNVFLQLATCRHCCTIMYCIM